MQQDGTADKRYNKADWKYARGVPPPEWNTAQTKQENFEKALVIVHCLINYRKS